MSRLLRLLAAATVAFALVLTGWALLARLRGQVACPLRPAPLVAA